MALTKKQVSLVTVATLGAAPGGYEADLAAMGTQDAVAAFIESIGLLSTGTNAEYALQVAKNLGASDATALFKALESGTSRAEATVDFANAQLVAQGGSIDKVDAAVASTTTSTDLTALQAALAEVTADSLTVTFTDNDGNQDTSSSVENDTVYNVGKAEIDSGAGKISADYTFVLKDQIDENDSFNGLFLSPIIDRQSSETSGSQIVLELRNLREAADSATPLKHLPTNGFGFNIDGELVMVQSDSIDAAETYAELLAAIQARVTDLANGVDLPDGADAALYAKLATFEVSLGNVTEAQERDATGTVTKTHDVNVTQIILKDNAGATLDPVGYSNRDGIIDSSGFTLFAQMSDEAGTTITPLITTNLVAENVGYGSQGASVNLAGQSASDKGVEEIKVTATKGVWFTTLQSKAATNHLERIELQTGSSSYFRVGTQKNDPNHVVALVDQDFTRGGLVDVQQLAASAAGSVAVNSFISDAVIARYELKDTGLYTTDDKDALIDYDLTSGNDVLNLAIDTDVLQAVDTKVDVSAGAGNDVITVMATKGANVAAVEEVASAATWLANQQQNDNITIDAGAGDDWVMTTGAGNATIKAGAGNDTVRVDNSGDRAVFVFNNDTTTNINELKSNNDKTASSGVTATNNAQTHNFFKAQVQVTFKGFESGFVKVEYDTTKYTTNNQQINQAIKKAINEDPVLSKLIAAHDNGANSLGIESLIDGVLAAGDLSVAIIPPVINTAAATDANKALAAAAGQLVTTADEETKAIAAYAKAGATVVVASITDAAAGTVTAIANYVDVAAQYATEVGTVEPVITTVTEGGAGTNEVQTIDFAGVAISTAGNIGFESTVSTGLAADVVVAAVTADTPESLAAKAAAQFNADANVNATVDGTVVTVTFDKAVAAKGINVVELALDGTLTTAAFVAAGAVSGAESDNVIDLGAGQDVLTLGTGALSNDTVVFKGYNLGSKSIVNFTETAATNPNGTNGEDLLDFTSYLTNVDATTGARIATTVAGIGVGAAGNGVAIVDYLSTEKLTAASTSAIAFDDLTAADVKAMINNDDAASGNLNVDIDATGAATLTQNYVVMLHNNATTAINGNIGEYKAFHVTSVGNSDEAATVQLIGTFDFGDVGGASVIAGIDATNFA